MKNNKFSLLGTTFDAFNYLILTLFMILCIYPFYYVFIYSISNPQLAYKGVYLLPQGVTLFNYIKVFQIQSIFTATYITVLRTVIGTVVSLLCCALFAYILTKKEMYLRSLIYRGLVLTMYLGAGLIPYYIVIRSLGLRNNFLVYIIPGAINAFFVILIKTSIEQIPAALEESAMIDGAGYFTTFVKVIFPLIQPICATIVVFSAVGQWNSWFDTYIFTSNKALSTLQYILLNMLNDSAATATYLNRDSINMKVKTLTPQSIKMTITMVTMIPILLIYPFAQKYFLKGIMLGAIKG